MLATLLTPVFSHGQVQAVVQAEYYFNVDPGAGSGTPLPCADGNCDEAIENIAHGIAAPGLAGLHRLYVRVKGSDGIWGSSRRVMVYVVPPVAPLNAGVAAGEYFFDTDPGPGNATPFMPEDGAWGQAFEKASAVVPGNLAPGVHLLNVRYKSTDGTWGPVKQQRVEVEAPTITVNLDLRMALQGTMGATLMNNTLRVNGLIPLEEPYSAMGFDLGEQSGTTTTSQVLGVALPAGASVVDWVLLELLPVTWPTLETIRVPLLLRRGGTVSDASGNFPFQLTIPAGAYHVRILHRNHMPVTTQSPVTFNMNGASLQIDFASGATPVYGIDAMVQVGPFWCLWAGNTLWDGTIKYTGANNDRDPVLLRIGGSVPTNTVNGYFNEDVNMDGVVKYTGSNNDRDPILVNIGGSVPTNVRYEQVP
ncbi:MAG: hypothetical protein H6591_00890 [Flavobacteriales bacterium]|nr:hypothetical protein [Flavobacteriales bacterium]